MICSSGESELVLNESELKLNGSELNWLELDELELGEEGELSPILKLFDAQK